MYIGTAILFEKRIHRLFELLMYRHGVQNDHEMLRGVSLIFFQFGKMTKLSKTP